MICFFNCVKIEHLCTVSTTCQIREDISEKEHYLKINSL